MEENIHTSVGVKSKKKSTIALLVIIFLLVLGFRLFFLFQTETFSDSQSYFNLRQIESIRNTGLPLFEDDLSYSGRFFIFLPLFHYLIAAFSFILPISIAVTVIPSILMASMVFIAFLISKELTGNDEASLISALLIGFVPFVFSKNVNTLSVYSLVLPLTFLSVLFLMKLGHDKRYVTPFVVVVVLCSMVDSSASVLIVGMFVYLFLSWLMKMKPEPLDIELITFSSLLISLLSLVLFKNLFLDYGLDLIRQNIPDILVSRYFSSFNVFEALFQIGLLPLVMGVYIVYKTLFIKSERSLYILLSFALAMGAMLATGMIGMELGIFFFSSVLCMLSALTYLSISNYLKKTKLSMYYSYFIVVSLLIILLTSVVPSVLYANQVIESSYTQDEIKAFQWIRDNTPEDSVVLASLDEGHLLTAISKRRNVIDTNFLLEDDADVRLSDVDRIYQTKFQTEAERLLDKYRVNYVIKSPVVLREYGPSALIYVDDNDCFPIEYESEDSSVVVYGSVCGIKEEQ